MGAAGFSDRLQKLPPYLFVQIDKAKRQALAAGRDVINLGIGDPDTPTPEFIIDAMTAAVHDPANHTYAIDGGLPLLRRTIADWYARRFSVTLDPEKEILPLIGSKEGIALFPLSVINPGDRVLVPDPCYPPYRSGSIFAGAEIIDLPLREENAFLPDRGSIADARLVYLNYPNNPTSACADRAFYEDVLARAARAGMMVVSDLAYSELYYDGKKPMSMLQLPGAKERVIEFHSCSKTYNMTGWRIGWACGNEQLIRALEKVKSNVDSGPFQAVQIAAITALRDGDAFAARMRVLYQGRRDALLASLAGSGLAVKRPEATFYVWIKVPPSIKGSMAFAALLLDRADIVATPGVGFGAAAEGYVRMALTVNEDRLREAGQRIKKIL